MITLTNFIQIERKSSKCPWKESNVRAHSLKHWPQSSAQFLWPFAGPTEPKEWCCLPLDFHGRPQDFRFNSYGSHLYVDDLTTLSEHIAASHTNCRRHTLSVKTNSKCIYKNSKYLGVAQLVECLLARDSILRTI